MNTLCLACQASIQPIDLNSSAENKKDIHALRHSLVDAFMSIINGIKSPVFADENRNINNEAPPNQFDELTFEHIKNMFVYIEQLVILPDLELN